MIYVTIAIAGLLLASMAFMIISAIITKKNTAKRIKAQFGKIPDDDDRDIEGVAGYYSVICKNDNAEEIDSSTWNDLDMDSVFHRANACQTSIGEEYLFALLHKPNKHACETNELENLIQWLDKDSNFLFDIQYTLACLGKEPFNGLHHLFSDARSRKFNHASLYKVLAVMPLLSAFLLFANTALGAISILSFALVNIFIYAFHKYHMDADFTTLRYLSALFLCCKILAGKKYAAWDVTRSLRQAYRPFRSVTGTMARTYLTQKVASELQIIIDVIKQTVLYDMLKYQRTIEKIARHQDDFRRLYVTIGKIDTAISTMSFRASLPYFCHPEYLLQNRIEFSQVYHPLLQNPVSNSGSISRGSIVTGSNASGKSTFIKALAINGILGLTINTCCAARFATRAMLVMTSMAVRDSITAGESYFVTEIKSLKRMIDVMAKTPCVCYIDEILRGTNTPERIAASCAVLQYLAGMDYLCVVASHDVELAERLKASCDSFSFAESITENGIEFDYKLRIGVSKTRNAIRLLEQMGFESSIIDAANAQLSGGVT